MRIICGILAVYWIVNLIGYWAGHYTPDSVTISAAFIVTILTLVDTTLTREER
jgi:hypothetical protein